MKNALFGRRTFLCCSSVCGSRVTTQNRRIAFSECGGSCRWWIPCFRWKSAWMSLLTAALRSWIVRRIHILELYGTLTEEDNSRFLRGVSEVIDVRRHLRKTADRQ